MYNEIKELVVLPSNPYSGGDSALNDANNKTWWAKELADHLDIGSSTLRKYSLGLEQAGYKFLRDEHDRRAYVERDALALRQLKKYLDSGMSYDIATKTVASVYLRSDSAEITPYAKPNFPEEKHKDERYEELSNKMDALIEMNKEFMMRMVERDIERDTFIEKQFTELKSQKALPPPEFEKALKELKEEIRDQQAKPTKPTSVFDERPWWSRLIKR